MPGCAGLTWMRTSQNVVDYELMNWYQTLEYCCAVLGVIDGESKEDEVLTKAGTLLEVSGGPGR